MGENICRYSAVRITCPSSKPGAKRLTTVVGHANRQIQPKIAITDSECTIIENNSSADAFDLFDTTLLYCGMIALSVDAVKIPIISVGTDIAKKKASVSDVVP